MENIDRKGDMTPLKPGDFPNIRKERHMNSCFPSFDFKIPDIALYKCQGRSHGVAVSEIRDC